MGRGVERKADREKGTGWGVQVQDAPEHTGIEQDRASTDAIDIHGCPVFLFLIADCAQ